MEIPLLLAGPIVRRADPGLVAVWAALSKPARVTLKVYEGRVAHDATNPTFVTSDDPPDPNLPPPKPGNHTLRIGERLHLAMLTARLPPASGKAFQPHLAYSYNLLATTGTAPFEETHDLHSLGLLTEHQVSGTTAGPLGYADRMLPSFVLPPSELKDLRIAYGSCRRPLYDDGDALAWLDQDLERRITDPRARTHQLFLGGDQIYADDVASLMMQRVVELGVDLIGRASDTISGDPAAPIERIKVNRVRVKDAATVPFRLDPDNSYRDETPTDTEVRGDLPAGPPHFPVDQLGEREVDLDVRFGRLNLTTRSAQFTSVDGTNHLISFGEFAATYLMAWSPACWGETVPGVHVKTGPDGTPGPFLGWLDTLTDTQDVGYEDPVYPDRIPQYLFEDADQLAKRLKGRTKETPAEKKTRLADEAKGRRRSHRVHRDFLRSLWRVQRVLANVPTYMMMDDHDVTDDFFLSPLWRRRVLGTALGQTILTNGMLAYALFQDWGNDPVRYDQTSAGRPELGGLLPGDLLDRAAELFPEGLASGPQAAPFDTLGRMFGHDLDKDPLPDGRFPAVRPPITWHFTIDGPKHRVIALDNRTRRSYVAEIGPPGNVSVEALVDQIPKPPLPAGREVLVVIAPLQVIGPPVLDEVVGRAIYRIFDAATSGDLLKESAGGAREMPGTNPDALETWALDDITYEHLLARLAEYRRVVLLSGDVHNAASNVMSYWRGDVPQPARLAQFTSSGFKNVMPVYLRALDASAMLLQQLLRAKIGVERLGWTRPDDDLVLLPSGVTESDLVAATRARLLRTPVLLPVHGWPSESRLNPAKLPEWRWRVTALVDGRPDAERPSPIRAVPLDDDAIDAQVAAQASPFTAIQEVARRHQAALDRMRNTRQMMFRSNFGICRFETDGDKITAVGEVWTTATDPDTQLNVLDAYMVHRADLDPVGDLPPSVLRRNLIDKVPIPAEEPL